MKVLLIALAVSLAAATPAAAQSGGISGGGSSGVAGGGSGALSGSPNSPLERSNVTGVERRAPGALERRMDTRSVEPAKPYEILRHGPRAAHAKAPLAGLHAGMMLRDRTGAPVGRIVRVSRFADGSVRTILIAPIGGHGLRRIDPAAVRLAGGVATLRPASPR
jgi:hypothetical protein